MTKNDSVYDALPPNVRERLAARVEEEHEVKGDEPRVLLEGAYSAALRAERGRVVENAELVERAELQEEALLDRYRSATILELVDDDPRSGDSSVEVAPEAGEEPVEQTEEAGR